MSIWDIVSSLLLLDFIRVGCPTKRTSLTFNSNFLLQSSDLTANNVDSTSSVIPESCPVSFKNSYKK